jgi:crotonobetainyl-CoA:carnitine CoA-transferase CaiB-like acyl-CoA transferase
MTSGPLKHLTVLDLTHYKAGPYATKLFSGFGASVIKIEKPRVGDGLRQKGPFVDQREGIERSIPFLWLNGGKQSLTLNLKSQQGIDLLKQLIPKADVLIENFSPGVMDRLGLDYETVRSINPGVIMTSISNFGQTGPYRHYKADEKVLYAMSGGMYATGDPDKPPLASGPSITQYTAGLHGFIATLMGLFARVQNKKGCYIDISIQESALENIEIHLAEFIQTGKVARRSGDEHPLVPWRSYKCRDGYAAIIGGPLRHWRRNAAELFEEPELNDPSLTHMAGRIENRRKVESLIKPWLLRNDREEIYHKGQKAGLAFGYLASLNDILQSPQLVSREFFVKTRPHPEHGELSICDAPFKVLDEKWQNDHAPLLGEHNNQIMTDLLGYSEKQISDFVALGVI